MARSTIKERKPKAPGTSVYVDFDAGSDLNSGFSLSNAVQTLEAFHNILGTYDFNDEDTTLILTGSTTESTQVELNLSGISNARKIKIISGNRTARIFIRNTSIPVEYFVSVFTGNDASIIVENVHDFEVGSGCAFIDKTSGLASIAVIDCYKVRVSVVSFTNFDGGDFINLNNVNNFSYDPLTSPTSVGTFIFAQQVQYMQLENGGVALTGQILNVALSPGVIIRRIGWNFTGTVPDSFPDYYILDGQPKYLNLPVYVDDAAAGVGGLIAGDVYQTSTGELRIKL